MWCAVVRSTGPPKLHSRVALLNHRQAVCPTCPVGGFADPSGTPQPQSTELHGRGCCFSDVVRLCCRDLHDVAQTIPQRNVIPLENSCVAPGSNTRVLQHNGPTTTMTLEHPAAEGKNLWCISGVQTRPHEIWVTQRRSQDFHHLLARRLLGRTFPRSAEECRTLLVSPRQHSRFLFCRG